MAYVPNFLHDVFISYAHSDNLPDASACRVSVDNIPRLWRYLCFLRLHSPINPMQDSPQSPPIPPRTHENRRPVLPTAANRTDAGV